MSIGASKLNQYYIRICDDDCSLTTYWIRVTLASSENQIIASHKHLFYELHYILTGEITIRVNDELHVLAADRFILFPPEQVHEITAYAPDTAKLVFGFDVELTDKTLDRKLKNVKCDIHRGTGCLRELIDLLLLLPDEQGSSALRDMSGITGIQLRSITKAFFFTMLALVISKETPGEEQNEITKNSYRQEVVEKMIAFIRSRTSGNFVTVDDITGYLHISKRHLNRICTDVTGKTARKILDEERLRYIRELLATTGSTLHEIALLSGFSNEQSLIRFFHQKESSTPTEYRKNILK